MKTAQPHPPGSHLAARLLLACAALGAAAACAQPAAENTELSASIQALASQLEQQQQLLQALNTPASPVGTMPPPGPAGSGAPTGFPDGAAQDPGQIGPPPSGPGDVPPPPSARPDPYGAFFAASPSNSASVLPSIGPETLAGSVWSGTPDRWAFLAERGLPASTMLIFRESDLLVVSANQTLSFRVDHRPTALQCRSLWPCISIIDENGVAHTVHYEALAAANAADPAALFVLDCITREQIEGGGDFPTEEALRENGGLLQRHRTADILCLRRLNDVGLLQVRVSSESGTTP